ncbi:RagB/SusD family nutrient uptake outer membrane protein [Parabacteroides sp.]
MNKNNFGIIKSTAKLFSATVLSGLFLAGCVDMDLTPKNQPSEGEVWADATMAEQTVTGLYNGLNHLYNDNYNMWFDCFSATMDRDANWRNFGMLFGNQTTSGDGPSWIWHDNYKFIIRCNDVIANMPDVAGFSEAKKARLIAEAKFLRSYWYYELNLLFGGVPYYTDPIKNIDEAKGSRLSMADLWNELVKDLTDCINEPNLPDKYNSGDNDYGHITKGAAYALRGKIYLWQENWASAEADFKKVGDCGYRLFTSGADAYKMLFKEANEQCDEMIFSVQCIEEDGYWNSKNRGFGNRCTYGSMWNNYLVNPDFVDTYECADGSKFDWSKVIPEYYKLTVNERRVFFLRDNLTESEIANAKEQGANMDYYLPNGNEARIRKAYDQRDPRLEMSVITPYATYLGGDGGADNYFTSRYPFRSQWIEIQNADGTVTREPSDLRTDTQAMFYYLNRKFVTEGVGEGNQKGTGIDMPKIRYADVLLNLAEALNEQGKTDEAIAVVNQVRARAGAQLLNSNGPTTVKGQADMRERIRNERYWELLGEDLIYFDELRWKTWKEKKFSTYDDNGKQVVNGLRQVWGQATYHYAWGGDHYWLYPIPYNETQMNPNMVQNTGWK